VAASVIAWIDEDTPNESVGRTLGPADKDQSPRLAEMRFMRLLRCDTPERLLLEARRMSRILGGRANVDDLGTTLAGWESSHGLRRRRTWAFDYWAKRSDAFAPVSATSNS
jgi:CRISPR type I-E-associated protein CasB/Cse2